ncbi:DEAD/DEAH box helicase [Rubritalea spongiae]|uniref:DEAD/DEAH box helicase n=1 Tax=Rubritalea spongiae TaxID=430797 RepID=UPI003609054A
MLDDALSRKELQKMWEGVRKRRGSDQQAILKALDYSVLLKALPVWLTSTEDMHRVLPLKKEMFDVLVIDEASQCDLASILPALQRAKRVVVVGDTKQLRHVSFLSKHTMSTAAKEFSVSEEVIEKYHYRNRSLMDVAIDLVHDQRQTGFLNEHFRSQYGIISYSNRRFYGESLQIMRERPWQQKDAEDAALKAVFVDGGRRDDRGVNQLEIDAIISVLHDLLKKYPKNKTSEYRGAFTI